MKLYIARHGDAVPTHIDPNRPLSEYGIEEINKIAQLLKPRNLTVEHIWHSTKLRAQQTAEILAESIQSDNSCSARNDLSPNDNVHNIADELEAYKTDLMIVGHLPYLGKLASLLTTGKELANIIDFPSGAIACLKRYNHGKWQIEWMITPSLLR